MIHLELTYFKNSTLPLPGVSTLWREFCKDKTREEKSNQSLQKRPGRRCKGYTHGKYSEKGEGFRFILMLWWHKTWLGFRAPGPASSTTSDKPLKTWFLTVSGLVKMQRSTYQHQRCTHVLRSTTEIRIPSPSLCKPYTIRCEAHKGRVSASFQSTGAANLHSSALNFTYVPVPNQWK